MTLFDFNTLSSNDVRVFVNRAKDSSRFRKGAMTAIVAGHDLGFGMMRMLQMLSEGQFEMELSVFRESLEAYRWLTSHQV